MNNILSFLNNSHYQNYYTPLAKLFKSIDAAIIFSEFIQRYQYHEMREELIEIQAHGNGWFYHTKENIEERTAMCRYSQDEAVKILKKFNLIETIQWGMPAKRYIRLIPQGIEELSKNLSRKLTVDRQGSLPSTDKEAERRPTASLYIEDPNKEPKEEGEKAPPPVFFANSKKKKIDKPPEIPKIRYGDHVFLKEGEYEELCKEIGKSSVDYYIKAINNHVPNAKPYKNYAATIRQWHLRDERNGKLPVAEKSKTQQQEIDPEEIFKRSEQTKIFISKNWEKSKQLQIYLDHRGDCVAIGDVRIKFNLPNFYDIFKQNLKKFKLIE